MVENIVYNVDDERVAAGLRGAAGRKTLRVGIRESSDIYANDIEIGEYGFQLPADLAQAVSVWPLR